MAAPNLSRADHALIAKIRLVENYKLARTAIRVGGCLLAVYLVRDQISIFAGTDTRVAFSVSILADVKFALALAGTVAATIWAVVERTLRHRKTEYLQDRIIALESSIDPQRSSSQLTRAGKTNPKDKGA